MAADPKNIKKFLHGIILLPESADPSSTGAVEGTLFYSTEHSRLKYRTSTAYIEVGSDLNTLNVDSTSTLKGAVTIGTDTASANLIVKGDITADGDITAKGTINLGDGVGTDDLSILARVTTSILPKNGTTPDIGDASDKFKDLYLSGKLKGNVEGNITGNLKGKIIDSNDVDLLDNTAGAATFGGTADKADKIKVIAEAGDALHYPSFVLDATTDGQKSAKMHSVLSYKPDDGKLSATTFSGNLEGDVDGDVSGNVTADEIMFTPVGTLPSATSQAGLVAYKDGLQVSDGTSWSQVGTGSGGGSSEDSIVVMNMKGVSTDLTIPSWSYVDPPTNSMPGTLVDVWNTPEVDTVSGWDAVEQHYVIPETGYYDMASAMYINNVVDGVDTDGEDYKTSVPSDAGSHDSGFDKDSYNAHTHKITGQNRSILSFQVSSNSGTSWSIAYETRDGNYHYNTDKFGITLSVPAAYLVKDTFVRVIIFQQNQAGDDYELDSSNAAFFNIAKRQSAQTLLENETVAMRCQLVNDQVISSAAVNLGQASASATNARVGFDTVQFDTHNGYIAYDTTAAASTQTTAGRYVVPVTGIYQVHCNLRISNVTSTNPDETYDWNCRIQYNSYSKLYSFGDVTGHDSDGSNDGVADTVNVEMSDLYQLSKGDHVSIIFDPKSPDTDYTFEGSSSGYCTLSIHKIK